MAQYLYRGIDLSGVDITLVEESGDFRVESNGTIERHYVITVSDSAFFTGVTTTNDPAHIYDDIMYTDDPRNNSSWKPERVYYGLNSWGWREASAHPTATMPVFAAACYKSWGNTARAQATNFNKYLPVNLYSRTVVERLRNDAFGMLFSGGSISVITPIGMWYSASLANYICTGYSLRWVSGALHVILTYSPAIFDATTISAIEMTVSAQRYPSLYGYNPSTDEVELNVVEYNNNSVVAELPDAYQGEWRWVVTTFDVMPLGHLASYVGKINSDPMRIMSVNDFAPGAVAGGIMCDGYSHTYMPVVAISNWSIPVYNQQGQIVDYNPVGYNFLVTTLRCARLTFVGYDQTMFSLDAGFLRALFYVDPDTGGVPPDAEEGNGIKTVYCAVPSAFGAIA